MCSGTLRDENHDAGAVLFFEMDGSEAQPRNRGADACLDDLLEPRERDVVDVNAIDPVRHANLAVTALGDSQKNQTTLRICEGGDLLRQRLDSFLSDFEKSAGLELKPKGLRLAQKVEQILLRTNPAFGCVRD